MEWNRRNIIALVLAMLSLACGGVIYLAFRGEDLLLYKAVDACGGMPLLTQMRDFASVPLLEKVLFLYGWHHRRLRG